MTTQQAIEALHALPRMGQGAPGLARMQNLCDHLGNPEKELQCIHIAGTNGKGSLAAMTSSILTAAGYKTGLTISPYVVPAKSVPWSCWRLALAGAATQRTSCPTSSWQPSQRSAMTTWKFWEIPLIKLPPRRPVL